MIPDEPKPDHIHDPYNHNNLNLKLTMTQTSFTRKGQILAGQHLQLFQALNIPFLFLFHQLLFSPNKVIRSTQTSGCNWASVRKPKKKKYISILALPKQILALPKQVYLDIAHNRYVDIFRLFLLLCASLGFRWITLHWGT